MGNEEEGWSSKALALSSLLLYLPYFFVHGLLITLMMEAVMFEISVCSYKTTQCKI
jgi:hypothetical protein